MGGGEFGSLSAGGVFQLVELALARSCHVGCTFHFVGTDVVNIMLAASKRREVSERSVPCIFSGTCCKRHFPEDSFARMRSLQNCASATAPLS